jgi:serine/threonine protein kinase
MTLEPHQVIDNKYRIISLIGKGGMGAVYEGENILIARRVAIKVLHAATAENSSAVQRFEREAQAAGRIGSDHILEILDLGSFPNGDRYMVMEFLDGETLAQRIRKFGKLTPEQCVPLFQQLLKGLEAAHNTEIIHRDLKPDNVFILNEKANQTDFVKIIDFGISKFNALSQDHSMTQTGAVLGTPYYMAPEQAKGTKGADRQSDVYSVGVILYEAVTGMVPFNAQTFNELIFKIVLSDPTPIQKLNPDLDLGFVRIIEKAMAKEAEDRFQTAEQFRQTLLQWKPGIAPDAAINPRGVIQSGSFSGVSTNPGTEVSHQTGNTWAQSHYEVPGKKRSSVGMLLAVIGIFGVVTIAGGTILAFTYKAKNTKKQDPSSVDVASQSAANGEKIDEKDSKKEEPAKAKVDPPETSATATTPPSAEPPKDPPPATNTVAGNKGNTRPPATFRPPVRQPPANPPKTKNPPRPTDFGYLALSTCFLQARIGRGNISLGCH